MSSLCNCAHSMHTAKQGGVWFLTIYTAFTFNNTNSVFAFGNTLCHYLTSYVMSTQIQNTVSHSGESSICLYFCHCYYHCNKFISSTDIHFLGEHFAHHNNYTNFNILDSVIFNQVVLLILPVTYWNCTHFNNSLRYLFI